MAFVKDSNLGKHNTKDRPSLMSYSSPSHAYLNIRMNKAPLTTKAGYKWTNAQGALVAQGQLGNPNMEYVVTLDKLATGLYTLTVYDANQVMHAQSVIVE